MSIPGFFPFRQGLLVLALALMAGCQRSPPEQRLRESMTAVQEAIETRDADGLEEWLAEDFIGPEGLDRDGVRRLARLMYLRHRNVGVAVGPVRIELREQHATVEFTALLTGGSSGLLPERGRLYSVQTGWRLGNGDWTMTSARWSMVR